MSDSQTSTKNTANAAKTPRISYELRLLLICHAEGMADRYSNLEQEDSGLTANGWKQTDALASWLKSHYHIDLLVSAPHLRNRLTAQRVGQALGLPVTVHQGLPASPQFVEDQRAGDVMRDLLTSIEETDGLGQPTAADAPFCLELRDVLTHIQSTYPGKTVAIVMGPGTISAAMACILQASNLIVDIDYTGISELRLTEGRWHMACVNRRQHIPMETIAPADQPESVGGTLDVPEDLTKLSQVYNAQVAGAVDLGDEERRKRIHDLIDFAQITDGMQILDAGAGTGLLTLHLADSADVEVVGVDISPAMLERAEYLRLNSGYDTASRVDFRLAAVQQLPFRDSRFDLVITRLMLHLSRKPAGILAELWRVLKPGGVLLVADLLSADDPVKRATQNAIEERRNPAHVAARSVQQYEELIEEAGFDVVERREVVFTRNLDDWLSEFPDESSMAATVRDMVEASLETDAAGINARHAGDQILFNQRLVYLRARKPGDE